MGFHTVLYDLCDSLRFGRVLLAQVSPPCPAGMPCRYCDVLSPGSRPPERAHFSAPEAAARAILGQLERGAALEAILLGGAGDPLRHRGIGSLLRKLRAAAHVPTILLTDGRLLAERAVRRDAAEAHWTVAWLPALDDASAGGHPGARRDAFEHHVEAIASLGREARSRIALEIPVRPGENDSALSRDAWRRAVERIRPERVFVIPDPHASGGRPGEALEQVRRAIHPGAGAFLPDESPVDQRCFCRG